MILGRIATQMIKIAFLIAPFPYKFLWDFYMPAQAPSPSPLSPLLLLFLSLTQTNQLQFSCSFLAIIMAFPLKILFLHILLCFLINLTEYFAFSGFNGFSLCTLLQKLLPILDTFSSSDFFLH